MPVSDPLVLLFQLSPSSGVPIFRQIMDQVARLTVGGQLHSGDLLPSVRTLAEHLEVNPMTISKAYSLLESQGVLQRQRGKGMIVAQPPQQALSERQRLKLLSQKMGEVVQFGQQLNLDKQQIQQALSALLEGKDD